MFVCSSLTSFSSSSSLAFISFSLRFAVMVWIVSAVCFAS